MFIPKPNVDSIVIELDRKEPPKKVLSETVFFRLIHDSFTQKRKTLRNNLKNYDLDKIEKILRMHRLDLNVRAEALSLEIFIDIANALSGGIYDK